MVDPGPLGLVNENRWELLECLDRRLRVPFAYVGQDGSVQAVRVRLLGHRNDLPRED